MYDMDMRDYDPAIGRWVNPDPIVHFDYSPYSAFDNNPIFFADPSGADSESFIMDLFNNSASGTIWTNNNNGSFSDGNGRSVTVNENENNINENENTIGNINTSLFENGMFVIVKPENDIVEYQKNRKTIKKNSVVLDALKRFSTTGQLESSLQSAYNDWYESTHDPIPLSERDQMLSDLNDLLNTLGVTATTTIPNLKIAVGIVSTPLMAQNTYLTIRNDMILAPRIKKSSPYWYSKNISHLDLGGGFSGGGAGGSW